MSKYYAKKTVCTRGHKHDSKREAARCEELHLLQRGGVISRLMVHPQFKFAIDGEPIKMGNGQQAKYTPDFSYWEGEKAIAEDVKGFIVRDFPLRAALFRALHKGWELRITQ